MGIKTTVVNEVHCDQCDSQINDGDVWVNWGERAIVFHWSCLTAMSALEFIQLALERGDQMFVKTDTVEMTGVELKHIWRDIAVNSDNVRKAVENYRMKYKG